LKSKSTGSKANRSKTSNSKVAHLKAKKAEGKDNRLKVKSSKDAQAVARLSTRPETKGKVVSITSKASGQATQSSAAASKRDANKIKVVGKPALTVTKGGGANSVVAFKGSVAERISAAQQIKKAQVVKKKSGASNLKLVANNRDNKGAGIPATKISRSETNNFSPSSKVVTGVFGLDGVSSSSVFPSKSGVDKGATSRVTSVASGGLGEVTPKAVIFKSGDKIVYPGHGVGEVESVRTTILGGQEHHIYNIKIIESGMKVMVPVSQAISNGIRKIVDRKAIDEVFSILKDRNFKIDTQTWNRRFREYSQKIKTGSVFEIAIVLRDLLVLSADKELSFGEKKMLDMAEGLLVSEIALAKSRPHDKVAGELRALFA
jgi:CarD family transcriptional regulator